MNKHCPVKNLPYTTYSFQSRKNTDCNPDFDSGKKVNFRKDDIWITYDALVTLSRSSSPEDFLTEATCVSDILINEAKKSFYPDMLG